MKAVVNVLFCIYGVSAMANIESIPLIHVPGLPAAEEIQLDNGFQPHRGFSGTGYLLEPLHRVHGMSDYQAWHEDLPTNESLIKLFGRAWGWPRNEMTAAQNTNDLNRIHYNEFLGKDLRGNPTTYSAYSYTVMDPRGINVIGSLYIYPSTCGTAKVFYWIVERFRESLERAFFAETKAWIDSKWGIAGFDYPGPDLSDEERGANYHEMEQAICR